MKNFKVFLFYCIIGLLLISCDKNIASDNQTLLPVETLKTRSGEIGYKVIDGVMHFDSLECVSALVNSLEKMSDQELFDWEQANDFYSLYHAVFDAEEDIFSDSLQFESKLEKYKNLVYMDNYGFIQSQVPSRFYQLICNKDGYFYVGKYKHKVTSEEIMVEDSRLRSVEKRKYIVRNSVQTRVSEDPRIPLASSSYKGNKRLVNVWVIYIRRMARNANGEWQGQQVLQVQSEAGKKFLGGYKKYKTVHAHDAIAFYCANGAYQMSDGTYSSRVVRLERLSGLGSVGEEKTCVIDRFLSPSDLWIPEKYIPIQENDIHFVQVRARTRGTGESGAVINYMKVYGSISFPFAIPQTGAPTILRPLVDLNYN